MKTFNLLSYDRTRVEKILEEAGMSLAILGQATDEDEKDAIMLRLLDVGLYAELEKFVESVRELVALKDVLRDESVSVEVLLDYHHVLQKELLLVVTKMSVELDNCIGKCSSVMDNNENCASEKAKGSEFVKGVEIGCVNEAIEKVMATMEMLQQVVRRYDDELNKIIAEIGMLDKSYVYGRVCDYVADYARRERKQEEKRLKMQAQKMKNERYEKLSDKHWCEVLECEERLMKQASEGKMESTAEACCDDYDCWMSSTMEWNKELMDEMMHIWTDDELFDMEQLLSTDCAIMELLTSENIKLFALLVLRGDIIRSKMNEELKRKFEAWMGDEEKEGKEKRNAKTNEDKRGEEVKGVLTSKNAMKEWAKLQRRGWIDQNLHPLTNMQFAAVIASVLGEKLNLKPKWAAFECLWSMKGLATKLTRALSGGSAEKYCDFQKEVEKALGMSHKRD